MFCLCTCYGVLLIRVNNFRHTCQFQDEFKKSHFSLNETPIEQPPEILIEMKDYQLRTIAWMTNIENNINDGWRISKLVPWKKVILYI